MATTRIVIFFIGTVCYFSQCMFGIVCDATKGHQPCTFSPLCTCLKPLPDLGTVKCINVPMITLQTFNTTRLNELHMENNGLRRLHGRHFAGTGMQNLRITDNPLLRIPAGTFSGLEKSLLHLELINDNLHFFPSQSIRFLTKLERIDLSNNFILQLGKEDFRGHEHNLKSVILSNNGIMEITQDVFSDLNALETLDLKGNRLSFIYETSFRNGPPRLKNLDLSDNVLEVLPFSILKNVHSLIKLNLSYNSITAIISSVANQDDYHFSLQELDLSNNYIGTLPSRAFRYFAKIDRLYLNYNPIVSIMDDAFQDTKITELYLKSCHLKQLSAASFASLNVDGQLLTLDVSHNVLTHNTILAAIGNLTRLADVSMVGNDINTLPISVLFNSSISLKHLHLESAGKMRPFARTQIAKKDLVEFTNLRSLGVSKFSKTSLTVDEFQGVSATLEKLTLRGSNLKSIETEAFRYMPNLKILDLSANDLQNIDKNTFTTLGHSLETLDLSNAFDPSLKHLPETIFESLINVKHLDLGNNRLQTIPRKLFISMLDLESLNLQDNAIENIETGTFTSEHNNKLERLVLSFNRIARINSLTFNGLHLQCLYLDDNDLKVLENAAFSNLHELEYIDLRGNRIQTIEPQTFNNLPNLEILHLAYNALKNFSLLSLEQVGTQSHLSVNVSHNHLEHLTMINANGNEATYGHTKIIDFSHNNISSIDGSYFDPIKDIVREISFSYNSLPNVTRIIFGNMPYLVVLKLDHNRIQWLDAGSFRKSVFLTLLDLSHNQISTLEPEIFSHNTALRHLDMSNNNLENLADGLFLNSKELQDLNLASNRLSNFPKKALASVALSLNRVGLSHNQITHLSSESLNSFDNLLWLDLSFNRLKEIGVDTLKKNAPQLRFLNIADNGFEDPARTLASGIGGQYLEEINLSNVGLRTMPNLEAPNLTCLNLSRNAITSTSPNFFNATSIRELDLSHNQLSDTRLQFGNALPVMLRSLDLSHNSFDIIGNDSFIGSTCLDYLNIQGLSLKTFQDGALSRLKNLRKLRTSLYDDATNGNGRPFDLVGKLSSVTSLQSLELFLGDTVDGPRHHAYNDLVLKSDGAKLALPPKLTRLVISGKLFKNFGEGALASLQNRHLHLTIRNTGTSGISSEVFKSASAVQFLQLEISQQGILTIGDPITADRAGDKGLFLTSLRTEKAQWQCDCRIGWIEHWMRQYRQTRCHDEGMVQSGHETCQENIQDLRTSQCHNRMNKTVLNVFKNELECTWKSSALIWSGNQLFIAFATICASTLVALYF